MKKNKSKENSVAGNDEIKSNTYLMEYCGEDVKDEFGIHSHIVDAMEKQILSINSKYNSFSIGLFGKWGSGKSFIVEKLLTKLKKQNIICFNIDVWKYNDQPLLRVILLDILKQSKSYISEKEHKAIKNEIKLDLYIGGKFRPEEEKPKWLVWLKRIIFLLVGIFIVNAVLSEVWDGWKVVSEVIKNFTVLGIPTGVGLFALSYFADKYGLAFITKIGKKYEEEYDKLPAFSPEQFEELFEKIISLILTKQNETSSKKIVFVFDNIDRCQPEYAYETLSCIKTYLNKSNYLYLIPCDDEAIKEHIIINRKDNRKFADEFLDKIFQTSFRIPLLKEVDTDEYISKMINNVDIANEISSEDINDITNILYYAYKGETPRQIRKFINDFITYFRIAQKVDSGGNVLLDDIAMFTVMIAIKQKFSIFEDEILKDNEYIISYYNSEPRKSNGFNQEFHEFLNNIEKFYNKNKPLRSYIYLTESDNELEIYNSLRDGNTYISHLTMDKIKIINTFFKNKKHFGIEENVQKSIYNYFIKEYDKAIKDFESLPQRNDISVFKKNIIDLLESKSKNSMLSIHLFISSMTEEVFSNFLRMLNYFSKESFAINNILNNLFNYDKNYASLLNVFLDKIEDKNEYKEDCVIDFVDKIDVVRIKKEKEKNRIDYTKFVEILGLILNRKRFDLLSLSFVNKIYNSFDESDNEITQYYTVLLSNKSESLSVFYDKLSEYSIKLREEIRTKGNVAENISKIDYVFQLQEICGYKSNDSGWTNFESLIREIIRIDGNKNNYLFKSYKLLLVNNKEVDQLLSSYHNLLIPSFIKSKDTTSLNLTLDLDRWKSLKNTYINSLVKNMNILWIGSVFNKLFMYPAQKVNMDMLLTRYQSESDNIKKDFKDKYKKTISDFLVSSMNKALKRSDQTYDESYKVIVHSFKVKLFDKNSYKHLAPLLKDVLNRNLKTGLELTKLLYTNNIIHTREICKVLECLNNSIFEVSKQIDIQMLKDFFNSILEVTQDIGKSYNEICHKLFEYNKPQNYFILGKHLCTILYSEDKLEDDLIEFIKSNVDSTVYAPEKRKVFGEIIELIEPSQSEEGQEK